MRHSSSDFLLLTVFFYILILEGQLIKFRPIRVVKLKTTIYYQIVTHSRKKPIDSGQKLATIIETKVSMKQQK